MSKSLFFACLILVASYSSAWAQYSPGEATRMIPGAQDQQNMQVEMQQLQQQQAEQQAIQQQQQEQMQQQQQMQQQVQWNQQVNSNPNFR